MSSSTTEVNITSTSLYDNELSFLYKQAIRLGVPYRFLLVRPNNNPEIRFKDTFDFESDQGATFTTIFTEIRNMLLRDNETTLSQIWDNISVYRGDLYNPLELIPSWLHAIPNFQVEHLPLLNQVNTYLANHQDPKRFNNMTEVVNYYRNVWLVRYNQELLQDYNILINFIRAQEEISHTQPMYHSSVILDSKTIFYDYPTEFGINPLPDIFNITVTDYVVPYVQYNTLSAAEKQYYKIYKRHSIDGLPNYNNIIPNPDRTTTSQTIYMNVWAGDDFYDKQIGQETSDASEEARIGKKDSFSLVTISYLKYQNRLRVWFSSPHSEEINENTLIRRIHNHISGLSLPPKQSINEVRISGSFMIYNIDLIEVTFSHLIMNDPLFKSYLYLEEGIKLSTKKSGIRIHYRGVSVDSSRPTKLKTKTNSLVSAIITQEIINIGDQFFVQGVNNSELKHIAQQSFPAINVRITRGVSRRVVQQFVDVLSRLFRRYCNSHNILNMYLYYIPEYANILEAKSRQLSGIPSSTEGGRIVDTQPTNIKILRKYASDVFVDKYSRRCQKPFQPKLINLEEVSIWQKKYITRGRSQEERQIMSFPKENPRLILVCPDDQYPYPGVFENKTLKNKHVYPYIPCCFRRNQLVSATSNLSKYYLGTTFQPKKATRSSYKKKGNTILSPNHMGLIPSSVAQFLKRHDEDSGQMIRFGVPRSANSFIHCVVFALQNRSYLTSINREEWVNTLRINLFNMGIRPELFRQELYDITIENIIQLATDNDEFFDPLKFYRAMEILFNCNIYIFAYKDEDPETGGKISLLQLPRHQYFHAHVPVPGKPVVLILRHWGSKGDALEFPQCELIIDDRGTEKRMIFSDSMNELLYPALTFVGRTLSWQIFETRNLTGIIPSLTCRLNVYSSMNYQMTFGQIPIIGQIIDTAGKARVFALAPEWSQPGKIFSPLRIFLNVPPTAPLNVPEFKPEDASAKLPAYNRLIELLGNPVSATVSTDERYLTGLWFPIGDIQFGFYCPCQDFTWSEFSQQYPDINRNSELNSLTIYIPRKRDLKGSTIDSSIQRISYLRRAARFVDQIVKYLFLIAGKPTDINNFLMSFCAFPVQPIADSVSIYDISKIPRILPYGNNVQSIITQLAVYSPIMFFQNHLIIFDQQMLQGITYQLKRFAKDITGLPVTANQLREIQGYYGRKEDFKFNPDSEFILGSLKEFNLWMQTYIPSHNIKQKLAQKLKKSIQTRLDLNAFDYQEPYIYQLTGNNILSSSHDPRQDKFYLIQNVAGNSRKRAIQVAYNWNIDKKNTGFTTEKWPDQRAISAGFNLSGTLLPVHVVYEITTGGGIIVQQNNAAGQTRFLEILKYGNKIFAAMLPIF